MRKEFEFSMMSHINGVTLKSIIFVIRGLLLKYMLERGVDISFIDNRSANMYSNNHSGAICLSK